jgi:hypothetical protein
MSTDPIYQTGFYFNHDLDRWQIKTGGHYKHHDTFGFPIDIAALTYAEDGERCIDWVEALAECGAKNPRALQHFAAECAPYMPDDPMKVLEFACYTIGKFNINEEDSFTRACERVLEFKKHELASLNGERPK